MIDDLLLAAHQTYGAISDTLGVEIIKSLPIWRHIPSIHKENLWSERLLDENYQAFITTPDKSTWPKEYYPEAHSWGIVEKGLLIDVNSLISGLRTRWLENNVLVNRRVDLAEIKASEKGGGYIYESENYRQVIIAGGYHGIHNPWFQTDVYQPAKGEVLICRIKDFYRDRLIKYKKFIVPLPEEDTYWIGSNYQHDFTAEGPDVQGGKELEAWLRDEVGVTYELIEHRTGIRAATKMRRPLVGEHPKHKGMYLFNGLGTKGISLAPHFSKKIIDAIASEEALQETSAFATAFHV